MTAEPRIVPVRRGVDLVVHGDPDRDRIGRRILDELDAVTERGVRTLRTFLATTFAPGRGEFDLCGIEVHASVTDEHEDVTLRFTWVDHADPVEWGNTWFDVGYLAPHPRRADDFRPVRFAIGFW